MASNQNVKVNRHRFNRHLRVILDDSKRGAHER